jgi:uncharacterized protein (UPF0276 family)
MDVHSLPALGVGLGYRAELHEQIGEHRDSIDCLEIVTDQFLFAGPARRTALATLANEWPVVPHGVGLSIGSAAGLSTEYLARLRSLLADLSPPWFSDHLSFCRVPEVDIEQLTPLWFTEETLATVCANIRRLQSEVDTPLALENITYYFALHGADMPEAEFLSRVLEETDIGLLLDVNNVHINSMNLHFDPWEFITSIPLERVVQVHIAGGAPARGMIVDTHGAPVRKEVWDLLDYVIAHSSVRAVTLEWDQAFPPFQDILGHLERARSLWQRHKGGQSHALYSSEISAAERSPSVALRDAAGTQRDSYGTTSPAPIHPGS